MVCAIFLFTLVMESFVLFLLLISLRFFALVLIFVFSPLPQGKAWAEEVKLYFRKVLLAFYYISGAKYAVFLDGRRLIFWQTSVFMEIYYPC